MLWFDSTNGDATGERASIPLELIEGMKNKAQLRPRAPSPLRSARKELLAPPRVVPPSVHPPAKAKLIASHWPLSYR